MKPTFASQGHHVSVPEERMTMIIMIMVTEESGEEDVDNDGYLCISAS